MKKVLFITNKWLNGPNSPIASQYDNILYTFPKDTEYEYDILLLDESAYVYGQHIDEAVRSYCKTFNFDTVIIIRLGISELNPTVECIKFLKDIGKKVCFFWMDTNPWDIEYQAQNRDLIDLNVSWDVPSHNGQLYKNPDKNQLYLWTPESDLIFYPSKQTIPVSFIGSLRYNKRAEYISFVKNEIPELVIAGGQREANLSSFSYGEIIRSSKININFPQHGMGYEQSKGRVFQAIASQSLLLENANASTRSIFTPDKDYVEFDSKEDLCDKIQYYLTHEEIRTKIANQGYQTYLEKYTSKIFWNTVMGRLHETT